MLFRPEADSLAPPCSTMGNSKAYPSLTFVNRVSLQPPGANSSSGKDWTSFDLKLRNRMEIGPGLRQAIISYLSRTHVYLILAIIRIKFEWTCNSFLLKVLLPSLFPF